MKKIQKGKPGYLNYKRKVEILRTVIYFVIVLAIFALGYWQTHTRLNLLTVVGDVRSSGIKGTCRCDRTLSISIN